MSNFRSGQNRASSSSEKPKTAIPFTFEFDDVSTGVEIAGHPMPEGGELQHLAVYARDAPPGTSAVFTMKAESGESYLNITSRISGGKAEFGKLPVQKGDQIVCQIEGPEDATVGQVYITYMLVGS
jgi:hypothetical protein